MATYSDGPYVDRIAGANLAAATDNFRIVKLQADATNSTGRSVIKSTATSDNLYGVLNMSSDVKTGETVSVRARNSEGTFKVKLGANTAAVSIGDALTVDTDSGALKTTTSNDQLIGYAEEAGVAGQVIEYRPVDKKF